MFNVRGTGLDHAEHGGLAILALMKRFDTLNDIISRLCVCNVRGGPNISARDCSAGYTYP
jgi:hypothetical protein